MLRRSVCRGIMLGMNRKKLKNDILLIAVLLVVAAAVWLAVTLTRTDGAYARVEVDGEIVMTLPLDKDADVVIGEGERTNRLIIKDGAAYVTDASCPDHLCVKQGEARFSGETIVCLPNKFVVTIVGGEDGEIDMVIR